MLIRSLWTTIAAACAALGLSTGSFAVAADAPAHRPIVVGFERFASDDQAAAGELLIGELNCIACHRADDATSARFMPKRAPLLDGVTQRVRPSWLRRYLRDPHSVKPGATMPNVLSALPDAARDAAADALTQFLASLPPRDNAASPPKVGQANIERGRTLYHTIGCVACHEPGDDYDPLATENDPFGGDAAIKAPARTVPSVPLGDIGDKYRPGQLAAFLRDPLHFRPAGRMPRIAMTDQEATDIAAYLTHGVITNDEPAIALDADKAQRGRALFTSLRCAACHLNHEGNPYAPITLTAPPLANLASATDRGCMSATPPSPGGQAPWYGLSDAQRRAIAAALTGPKRAPQSTEDARLRHAMLALNCYACHHRGTAPDGAARGGPEPGRAIYFVSTVEADLGDEGRLPPALTGVGAKLLHDTLRDIVTSGDNSRPYMATRMPAFGSEHAAMLSDLLERVDLPTGAPLVDLTGEEKQARNAYGRELVGNKGLNCVTCHNVRGHRSLGIPAIDLALAPNRLRPSWFKAYLLDPAHFKPGTRMPNLFPSGKSAITRVLGGNGSQQIDAIWTYLKEIEQTRLPDGIEKTDRFVLKPQDKPIVFRTFVKGTGTHAIVVGYPPASGGENINVAFDSETVRWALAWRGAFIDAQATWDDRFTPWTEPLGKDVLTLPPGPMFAVLKSAKDPWPAAGAANPLAFTGYVLDAQRRPHMRYAQQGLRADDVLAPAQSGGDTVLRRTLTIEGRADHLWLRVLTGKSITPDGDASFTSSEGWRVRFITPGAADGVIRSAGKNGQELIAPIGFAHDRATIELEMRWVRE